LPHLAVGTDLRQRAPKALGKARLLTGDGLFDRRGLDEGWCRCGNQKRQCATDPAPHRCAAGQHAASLAQ
jgi:hypothetical protein